MKSVVIVGAGAVGLMCAVRLAKAGARVTLLEAETEDRSVYGAGASAAAAGMLAPLGETGSPHDQLALASLDLWREWRTGSEWADAVRFDGGVAVCADDVEAQTLLTRASALGRKAEPLSAARFRKLGGLRANIDHAVLVEDEGVCDPVRMLSWLAMQALTHGVIIDYDADVDEIDAGTVRAHDGGVHKPDAIVLAPGVWATEQLKRAAPALAHVTPAKGQLVPVTLDQPLAPNLRAGNFYLTQRREDVVLGASYEPGKMDRRVDPGQTEELLAAANALLPGEVKPVGRGWAGIRPMSPDGWPLIGPSGDVLIAAGHSRNGWLLAPITAEIITAYVFGAEIPPAWAALSPQRFETP